MRQILVRTAGIAIVAVVLLGIPEVVFRLFPSLISLSVLDRMHPDLRSEIAGRLDLPVASDYAVIPSAERFDEGPDLFLMRPDQVYFRPLDPIDKAFGAIETMKTDARGFCNPEALGGRNEADIVTVGGSITNCAGVDGESVFPAQLGRLVGADSYNMSVGGVGPYEYQEVLERHYDALRPPIVIFAISEANDLRDCVRYLEHLAGNTRDGKRRLGGPFRYSYLLAFVKGSVETLWKEVKRAAGPNFRYTVEADGRRIAMNLANKDLDELRSARKVEAGELDPGLYRAPLERFVAFAREKGFRPVVLLVPAAYTIYQAGIAFEDPAIAGTMAHYSEAQRSWLAENAAAIGYGFLDATGHLQERAASGPLLYFPSDLHLTSEGHRALAAAVAEPVRAMLARSDRDGP